jgi:Fe-S oxidoreductase
MEDKLNLSPQNKLAQTIILSCSLCGKCGGSCAGQIPTAEHVLQMRRALKKRVLPPALHYLLCWRRTAPKMFRFLLGTGLFLRRLGVLRVLRFMHLCPSWLTHADDILPQKTAFLAKKLVQKNLAKLPEKTPTLIYLPSLEVSYFTPDVALNLLEKVQRKHTPEIWHDTPSGLFSYVYQQDVRRSRLQLRRLIKRHARTAGGRLPLLTDSIDVYLFLKNAPQLFAPESAAQLRARRFAQCIIFASDFLTPAPPQEPVKAALQTAALLWRAEDVFTRTEKIFVDVFGKNFVECPYTDVSVAAGGYSFVNTPLAQEMGLLCVRNYARHQVGAVFTLSVLAQWEMNFLFKQFYPHAKAYYLMQTAE